MEAAVEKQKNDQKKAKKKANPLRIARRSLWYLLRLLIILTGIVGLCYGVFIEAMYVSNVYIIVTEGMALRADVILTSGATADLKSYFTEGFINSDYMLYEGAYDDYTVDSYDYRFSIENISVLPWSKNASIIYVERIPSIQGSANSSAESSVIPAWTAVRYNITMTRVDGRWLVSKLAIVEINPVEEAKPTPDYAQLSPSPVP